MTNRLELTWVDKDRRLLAHDDVSYEWVDPTDWRVGEVRLLHDVDTVGDPSDGNLLIRGDAMHALEALIKTPEYAARYVGKVKLVYIDPPFNTGQAFGDHYEDNLEHSVWLTMLRDRLEQIQQLLAPDGSVWVHLDDVEQHRARCVLDEIFGAENFVATVIWQKADSPRMDAKQFSFSHDYIIVYAAEAGWAPNKHENEADLTFPYRDPDGRHFRAPGPLRKWGSNSDRTDRPNLWYPITAPDGQQVWPIKPDGREGYWRWQASKVEAHPELLHWEDKGSGLQPYVKEYEDQERKLVPPTTWWPNADVGHNREAKAHLKRLFGPSPFSTPKPERLLERVIQIGSDPGDVVLDCFGGSGTAAAVAHKMGRRWVSAEVSAATISTFMRPRLEMVVKGEDPGGITESVGWEGGGGFTHVEVGPSMFETVEGSVVMAEWAVGGELAEAVAAQLGFEFVPEGPLAGRKGRKRLAVVDGMVTEAVAEHLVGLIGEKETLLVVARSLEPGVEDLVRELRSGSRARKIPRDLARVGRLPSRLVRLNKKGGGVGG